LGYTYRVVEVDNTLNAEKEDLPQAKEEQAVETQENLVSNEVVTSEPQDSKETQAEVEVNTVEEVKLIHPKETKTNTTQVNKVHSPTLEDDSVIPSNIASNINNIIEDNETPSNLLKIETTQTVTESSTNLTNTTAPKSNFNQSVHNFQITSRKPNEELTVQSHSITLGNTNNVSKPMIIPSSGTPFQINAQQNKKPITTQTTKNTQTQHRKPENLQTNANMNPIMGSPEYYAQMQGGYMPWPMVYFPPMQGMGYDPSSMAGVNPMYSQNYYMQPNDMEENFVKNKKTNFPPIQTPNINVKYHFLFLRI